MNRNEHKCCPVCGNPFHGNRHLFMHNHEFSKKTAHETFSHQLIFEHFIWDDAFRPKFDSDSDLAFRFRQLIGSIVKITIEESGESQTVLAKICEVGSGFVEVEVLEEMAESDC